MQSVYENQIRVPLRDGVTMNATLFRPAEGRAPTLVVRTPYGIDTPRTGMPGNGAGVPNPTPFVDLGFAVLWVEARGTFSSEGSFRPVVDERDDGVDTIDWVIAQPWSDGTVGTYGASYLGIAQWSIAASGHPAVKAIAPMFTSMDPYDAVWRHPGGALSLSAVTSWNALMTLNDTIRDMRHGGSPADLAEIIEALRRPEMLTDAMPIAEAPVLAGRRSFDDAVSHTDFDEFWDRHDQRRDVGRMRTPALSIAGWYDVFMVRQLRDFELLQSQAATAEAREQSRLIVGPWDHDPDLTGRYSDHDFGPMANAAASDLMGEHLRHFSRWLRDTPPPPGWMPVKLFVMGIDEWQEFSAWPPAGTRQTPLHLSAGRVPRSGSLATLPPESGSAASLIYDPRDPVPTTGGAQIPASWRFTGPTDQRALDSREDILTFRSDPLRSDLEVIGYISAVLFVRSDAPDTDFTAKLIDEHPDGTARVLCDGIVRLRYRESTRRQSAAAPGEVHEVTIDVAATANVFRAGHRIRLDVSSSNFPRFDRNTNTGGVIHAETLDDTRPARNEVLTGREWPSRLLLPTTAPDAFGIEQFSPSTRADLAVRTEERTQ